MDPEIPSGSSAAAGESARRLALGRWRILCVTGDAAKCGNDGVLTLLTPRFFEISLITLWEISREWEISSRSRILEVSSRKVGELIKQINI